MYNDPVKRRCPKHPTIFEPCPLEHDPAPDPAIGGVNWNVEANVSPIINPVAKFAPPKWRGRKRPLTEVSDIFTSDDLPPQRNPQ